MARFKHQHWPQTQPMAYRRRPDRSSELETLDWVVHMGGFSITGILMAWAKLRAWCVVPRQFPGRLDRKQ